MISEQMQGVLRELELFDADCRENGTPPNVRDRWGVTTNVGPWIIGRDTAEWLYALVVRERPAHIVECGTSIGYSTIWLAAAAQTYDGQVTSIEKADFKHVEAQQNLAKVGLEANLILGDAKDVLHAWQGPPIDLLFLDANKKGYLPQFLAAEPYLSPSAVVIADNVEDMETRVSDFLVHIQKHPGFETEVLSIDHGLLIARKK